MIEAAGKVRAERDALSLLLRGMARKLVDSRRHGRGWHDQWIATRKTVHTRTAERDALLPRLAELTERAGKERTTEWLNVCAHLPVEEWPPAPAYKGPMVPAAERDERQTRIDAVLRLLDEPAPHQPRTDPHFERMNARDARAQLVQRLRAALVGDQPTAEEPYRCPTLCDDDCESPCHEAHAIPRKRQHDVADCEARQPLSGEALRDVEERDDAAEDVDHG